MNLAARLESHTKEAGRPILVDGATRAQMGEEPSLEPLGRLHLKGVATAVEVFAVA